MVAASATAAQPDGPPPSQVLLDEFRPFLDESVILAILGDYDDLAANIETARSTLAILAESAWVEESCDFNPSGVADDPVPSESQKGTQRDATDPSVFTDGERSLSPSMSDSASEPLSADVLDGLGLGVEEMPDDEKLPALYAMFPEIKPFDVSFELKRASGDFDKALAALLTIQYLDETGQRQRGTIDAAFSPEQSSPGRRRRGKKNKKAAQPESSSNKHRLELQYSLAPLSLEDPDGVTSAAPSAAPSAGRPSLMSPISFTSPSRSATAPPASTQIARPPDPSAWQEVVKRKKPPRVGRSATTSPIGGGDSTSLRDAALESFNQAHAAWRHGKSNPLHRPAAVVYAERGHALVESALAIERAEHEDLVNRQSTAGRVDLHGVTVRSGVEIALERTREWWRAVGDREAVSRGVTAKREPLYVVTGAGKHSVGGVSRLRKAVGVALARDGWIAEARTGEYVVTGRKN
ncbi:hypothetical protein GGTG_07542 [Gaeumannomyces tritici R3-111a-1]|uniref:Smr domain-containing protein n=1 Tax=Gaeumannomyces tritici (strain R3-111a-1) TaxID=644352 RepID=J3P1Z4_GAET3|nr:hypothetical protein GGTG_07542 [Gaeumannomyces tritici R3-111a-1]EJT73686.1 hypothetical protein GGTG_07542 [Gaeumannomyces tritici R3-111a-1]